MMEEKLAALEAEVRQLAADVRCLPELLEKQPPIGMGAVVACIMLTGLSMVMSATALWRTGNITQEANPTINVHEDQNSTGQLTREILEQQGAIRPQLTAQQAAVMATQQTIMQKQTTLSAKQVEYYTNCT